MEIIYVPILSIQSSLATVNFVFIANWIINNITVYY